MRRQNLALIRENDDKIKVPKEPKPLRFKGLHLFTRDIHNEIRTQKTPQRKSFAQIGNLSSNSLQSLVDRSERSAVDYPPQARKRKLVSMRGGVSQYNICTNGEWLPLLSVSATILSFIPQSQVS
jgi:hypothetical protein